MESALICSQSSPGGCRGPTRTSRICRSGWTQERSQPRKTPAAPAEKGGGEGLVQARHRYWSGSSSQLLLLAKTGGKSAATKNDFCPSLPELCRRFCMENSGHDGAAVLCLPSTETTSLFQKGFVCLSKALRILGFKANPQPGGQTLVLSGGLVGHSPGPFHRHHPGTVRQINEKWVFFPNKFLLYPQFFKAKCHFRIYSNLKVVKFLWTELYLSKHCP